MSRGAAKRGFHNPVRTLEGIRPYNRDWFSKDILAGVTLAALAIPEVMGYTKIAGTPVITGLYTILIPIAAFALFGSSRHLVVGGDSATAAIMYAGIAGLGITGLQPNTPQWVAFASLSALLAAGFLFLARVARLAFLANFLSRTVLVGFLTGVGIQVAMGQVGGMLGIPPPDISAGALSGTVRKFWLTLKDIGSASWQTSLISAIVLATLIVFSRSVKQVPGGLVAVIGMIALSWIFNFQAHDISILGPVPSGLPHIGFPAGVTWSDAGKLLTTAASLFLVILAQSAATSRAYAVKYREPFDEGVDLVGLALANIGAGLSSTFVVNGSPTKTEMADEGGSHTQVAMLTTAAVVAIVLLFLTYPLQFLPNAVLASVVFLIGLKLVDISGLREIQRLRKDEFAVALTTAVVVVGLGVEQGIVLAIVLSLLLHVRRHYEPVDVVLTWDEHHRHVHSLQPGRGVMSEPGLVVYRFGAGIFYANAQRLSDELLELASGDRPPRWVVLDAASIDDIDFTGGKTLGEIAAELKYRGIVLAVADVRDSVRRELTRYGITHLIGADRIFDTVQTAVDAFHADAPPGPRAG
ncbi:MAG TPA: SulP family inorganic anion transporter [Gaiellaceae bacterium]|nr:SulP family inorganic anion transporter [Gaiellaceae bacterium]